MKNRIENMFWFKPLIFLCGAGAASVLAVALVSPETREIFYLETVIRALWIAPLDSMASMIGNTGITYLLFIVIAIFACIYNQIIGEPEEKAGLLLGLQGQGEEIKK